MPIINVSQTHRCANDLGSRGNQPSKSLQMWWEDIVMNLSIVHQGTQTSKVSSGLC